MIFTRRIPLPLLAAASLLAAPPTLEARAQALLDVPLRQPSGRLMVDGYLSQYRLALPDARATLDGVGGRVLWTLAPSSTPRRERLAEHLAIGGFVGASSDDAFASGAAVRTTLVGAQLDVRPLRAPVAGVIEPVLSLGGGVLRLTETRSGHLRLANGELALPRDVPMSRMPRDVTERETHAVMTPAIGLMVSPDPGFAMRLDLRHLLARDGGIGRSSELAAGVSLRL